MKTKGNIAVFVPHEGCPNQCSFCNQKTITTVSVLPTPQDVLKLCVDAELLNKGKDIECELAFFGGSFTAIDRDYMLSLLKAAKPFIEKGIFSGIRISTRPDKIDKEILDILKNYKVTAIELGCQSTDSLVLVANKRGHSKDDIINSAKLIKEYGFSLGVQMMTGLYKDTKEKSINTAKDLISLAPDTVRIYPTVVLPDTELATLFKSGEYTPFSLEDSIPLVAEIMQMFFNKSIKIIRVGLHSEDNIGTKMLGGAYHPALRELCENYIYLNIAKKIISQQNTPKGNIEIYVPKGAVSKMAGQKKCNILKLQDLGYNAKIKEDNNLFNYDIRISKK